jgi:hypothetical protein
MIIAIFLLKISLLAACWSVIYGYIGKKNNYFSHIGLLMFMTLFVTIYIVSNNEIGDDRMGYYMKFLFYGDTLFNDVGEYHKYEYGFYFLSKLFYLYSEDAYSFYFSMSIVFLFGYILTFRKLINMKQLAVLIPLILFSKLYLDFMTNGIKTGLAGMFLIMVMLSYSYKKNYSYIFFLIIAFLFHPQVTALWLFIISTFYLLLKFKIEEKINYLFYLAILIYYTGIGSISSILLYLKPFVDEVHNGFDNFITPYDSSITMILMITVYIIIPCILLITNLRKHTLRYNDERLAYLMLFIFSILLILYESFPVVLRIMSFSYPILIYLLIKYTNKYSKIYLIILLLISILSIISKLNIYIT